MASDRKLKVLFSGYAHVHYACFRSLHRHLMADPNIEVWVSGGLRTKSGDGYVYNEQAMYRPFGVPAEAILSVDQIRECDFDVLFAGNTKLILPRSATTKVQIFHGCSFRNKAVRPDNLQADYWFMLGPYMRRQFAAAGILAEDDPRALSIGFMKSDRLLDGSLDRTQLVAEYGLGGDRPIVLYAPTGARQNSLETMGEEVIERLLGADKYDLLIKLHDHPKNTEIDWFDRLACFEGRHCAIARELDVTKLLFAADLLLSDASSVSSEYSLMDRPMVFLDTPELIARAQAAEHSMTDLETWGRKCGIVAYRPDDIVDAVERSLNTPLELSSLRQVMARDLFYNPGRATDAAMGWLMGNVIHRPRALAA